MTVILHNFLCRHSVSVVILFIFPFEEKYVIYVIPNLLSCPLHNIILKQTPDFYVHCSYLIHENQDSLDILKMCTENYKCVHVHKFHLKII